MEKTNFIGVFLVILGAIITIKGYTKSTIKTDDTVPKDQQVLEAQILGNIIKISNINTGLLLASLGISVLVLGQAINK